MEHHIKIVAANFGLNYHNLYCFCLLDIKNPKSIGIQIHANESDDGYIFITVPTSGTEKLIQEFEKHLKLNAIKYLPLKTYNEYEYYGLKFQINGELKDKSKLWTVCYWSNFINRRNKNIDIIFGSSIEDCAYKLYKFFEKEKNKLIEIKH